MVTDMTSEALTANYVNQLKAALVQKSEECDALKQQNAKLTYQISQMEAYVLEISAEKKFHESRASLITTCQNSSSNPSDVVNIVSSWLPADVEGSIACCLKIGDNWMIIEEVDEDRLSSSAAGSGDAKTKSISSCVTNAMLEEVVLCCGLSEDGICNSNPIDESILPAMGWSQDHDSVAVVVCPQCVWVLVSLHSQQTVHSIRGFYNLLESSSELIMGTVSSKITQDDVSAGSHRMQSSLAVCELLLTPPSSDGSSALTRKVWEQLPQVLTVAAPPSFQSVTCDVMLFVSNARTVTSTDNHDISKRGGSGHHQNLSPDRSGPHPTTLISHGSTVCTGSPTLVSACLGPLPPRLDQHHHTSLTMTAIKDSMDILICNDPLNIARDPLVDCGFITEELSSSAKRDNGSITGTRGNSVTSSASSSPVYLAILPLWSAPEHTAGTCFLQDNDSSCPVLGVSGAIIYRKQGEPFTKKDIIHLQQVRMDSLGKVCHWLEAHLCGFVRHLVEGRLPNTEVFSPQHSLQLQHPRRRSWRDEYSDDSPRRGRNHSRKQTQGSLAQICNSHTPALSLRDHHDLIEVFLRKGLSSLMNERSVVMNTFLTTSFECDWVVLIDVSSAGQERGSEGDMGRRSHSAFASFSSLPLLNDHGETSFFDMSLESVVTTPLSQAIKHFLHLPSSPTSATTHGSSHSMTDSDEVVVFNHIFTEHASSIAGENELRALLNSLLHENSRHQLPPRGEGVTDLLPLHVFCTKLKMSSRPPTDDNSAGDECALEYVAVGGRLWTPLDPEAIKITKQNMKQIFCTFESCRKKDSLYDVIAAAKEDIAALEERKRCLEEAEREVSQFRNMLSLDGVKSDRTTFRTSGHTLLEALHFSGNSQSSSSRGIFPLNTQLVVCAADAITGRYWQLADTRGRLGGSHIGELRWRPMEAGLKSMVEWPTMPSAEKMVAPVSSDLKTPEKGVKTAIGLFFHSGGDSASSTCYHLHPLPVETSPHAAASSSYFCTLNMFLLVVCPEISQLETSLSPFIRHWVTSLDAFFAAHSLAITHPHTDSPQHHHNTLTLSSSSARRSNVVTKMISMSKVFSSVLSGVAARTQHDLRDLHWATEELDLRGRRHGGIDHKAGRSHVWHQQHKPFEYLSDVRVWENATCDCCGGQVSMLVPLLKLNEGRRGGSGGCLDLLHPQDDVPAAVHSLITPGGAGAGAGAGADSVDSATGSETLKEGGRLQFQYAAPDNSSSWPHTSSLSVYDQHCPVARKTLQSYLQGKGNFNLNIATDTLLRYSYRSVDDADCSQCTSIHVFLLLPLDFLFTLEDLAHLEASITATLAPTALLQAHNSLRQDVTRLLSVFHPPVSSGKQLAVSSSGDSGGSGGGGDVEDLLQNSQRHLSIAALKSPQKTPLYEQIYALRVSNAMNFLGMVADLFASKPMCTGAALHNKHMGSNNISRRGGGDSTSDSDAQHQYELIDGTVYTVYGSDDNSLSGTSPSSSPSANSHARLLSKAATHNFFKQKGGNFKKTFSGSASLLPLPDSLQGNTLLAHLVPSGVQVDIIPERQLMRSMVRTDDEGSSEGDSEEKEQKEKDNSSGRWEGAQVNQSDSDESVDDEENIENPLGSVQYIRISFFQQPAFFESDRGDTSSNSGSGSYAPSLTVSGATVGIRRGSTLAHEKVIILLRGIVVSSVQYPRTNSSQSAPPPTSDWSIHSSIPTPIYNHENAVMVSDLIPLADLHILAEITNHSLCQLALLASAGNLEQKEQSERIGRYQDQVSELLGKIEHMFMQLSNPKLRNVHSLSNLSSSSLGMSTEFFTERLGVSHRQHTHADALDSTLGREKYYKSQNGRDGRGGGGGVGCHYSVTGSSLDFSLGLVSRTASAGSGLQQLVERERLFDKEYSNKINAFVAEMVKKSVGICQKMKESLSSSDEQAARIRELQDSEAAYANEVADLRQQLHNSSLHVDTFLNSVTDRLAPIMRMLHENISPRSGTIQECDEQKDEPDGDEVSSGSAQHLILIHLDIIQHASAYYHDLLVYLIGEVSGEKHMHIKLAEWILGFSDRWTPPNPTPQYNSNSSSKSSFRPKWKLFWPPKAPTDQFQEQLQQLPESSGAGVASSDALAWAMRSLSSTTTAITITDDDLLTLPPSADSAGSFNPRGPLVATYVPIVTAGTTAATGIAHHEVNTAHFSAPFPAYAVLQELHAPGEALFAPPPRENTASRAAGSAITLPIMLYALLCRLIESYHQHAATQHHLAQTEAQQMSLDRYSDSHSGGHTPQASLPRTTITYQGKSLSYNNTKDLPSAVLARARDNASFHQRKDSVTVGISLDLFRRQSCSWQQASLVGQCLLTLSNAFFSPTECLANTKVKDSASGVDSGDDADVCALCEAVLALSGGICNVGVLFSNTCGKKGGSEQGRGVSKDSTGSGGRHECDGEGDRDKEGIVYVGEVYHGSQRSLVTVSHVQLARLCAPMPLAPASKTMSSSVTAPVSDSEADSGSSLPCAVGFQPSVLLTLANEATKEGEMESEATSATSPYDCYILRIPLADRTAIYGYAILEYAHKPDLALIPAIQSLSLNLIRKRQYRQFVTSAASLQWEVEATRGRVLSQEHETLALAGSLCAYKVQWQAFHDFEALLLKSSSTFSRITLLMSRGIDDSDSDCNYSDYSSDSEAENIASLVHRRKGVSFDVNRDWLELWAEGATPHTQHLYSGRSESTPSRSVPLPPQPSPASSSAESGAGAGGRGEGEGTTADVITSYLQQTFASLGPALHSLLGGGGGEGNVKSVAVVLIDQGTLETMRHWLGGSGVQRSTAEGDMQRMYSDMEAVEVGALSLLAQPHLPLLAPSGVRGHPSDPLIFLPVATTQFSPSSASSFPSSRSIDANSSGWVLVVSFASTTHWKNFVRPQQTPPPPPLQSTEGAGSGKRIKTEANTDQDGNDSAGSEKKGREEPSVQSEKPLTGMETAEWVCQSMRRWVQTIEVQFAGCCRRRAEAYTRAVCHESTQFLATLSSLQNHPSVKKHLVCTASVAASVAHLLHSLHAREGTKRNGLLGIREEHEKEGCSVVAIRMHWKEADADSSSFAPQWLTTHKPSSSSPSHSSRAARENTQEHTETQSQTQTISQSPISSSPVDSLLHCLKHLLWAVTPSPLPAPQLDQAWAQGRAFYRHRAPFSGAPPSLPSHTGSAGGAVRQLYALSDCGHQVVLEIILRTPSQVWSSFKPMNARSLPGLRIRTGYKPRCEMGAVEGTNFAVVSEEYWEQVSKQPALLAVTDADAATTSASYHSEQNALMQETISLIPTEISLLLKNMHRSLQNQQHITHLKHTENESYNRVHMLTHCLKELSSSKKKAGDQVCVAVIQGVEEVLRSLEGVLLVDIYCRDTHPRHLSVVEQDRDSSEGIDGGWDKKRLSKTKDNNYHVIYGGSSSSSSSVTASEGLSVKQQAQAALLAEKQRFLAQRRQQHASSAMTESLSGAESSPRRRQGREGRRLDIAALLSPPSSSGLTSSSRGSDSDSESLSSHSEYNTAAVGSEPLHFKPHNRRRSNSSNNATKITKSPSTKNTKNTMKKENKNDCKYEFFFQAEEVEGTLTVHTASPLSQNDTVIFTTVATALGRRIYELYSGGKNMRLLEELQKELALTRGDIRARESELQALEAAQQEHIDAMHATELKNEELKGMLRAEGAALEGSKRLKRESEQHLTEVLETYKAEFASKEADLVKALAALKRRCLSLEKQVREETAEKMRAQGEVERISDRAAELEEKRRTLADEIIVTKVDSVDKINALESRLAKLQDDIVKTQKQQVSAEAKLKAQSTLFDHKSKSAKEQKAALEQEVAASRTTCARLKQQVDSTTRSLALCQRELETSKLREGVTTTITTTTDQDTGSKDVTLRNSRTLRRQATIGGMTTSAREKTVKSRERTALKRSSSSFA